MPLEVIERDVAKLAEAVRIKEFKFLGGEPLLHPQLAEAVTLVGEIGIAETLTIITNGLRLHEMAPRVWEGINRLCVSLYPGVRLRLSLVEIADLGRAHGVEVLMMDHREKPFRLTSLNQPISDDGLVQTIFHHCLDRRTCNTLHHGRFLACTPAMIFPERMRLLGRVDRQSDDDFVEIHSAADLYGELGNYLHTSVPFDACRFCLGSMGMPVPAEQGTRMSLAARLAEDHSDPRSLLHPDVTHKLALAGELAG